jgi:hypothetical protein
MNRITTAAYTEEFREEATTSSCRPGPANWLANKKRASASAAQRTDYRLAGYAH